MASVTERPVGATRRAGALQTALLALLRIAVGWHFLYEGVAKLTASGWTAAGYLHGSHGPLAPFFRALATSPATLRVVDALNVWGLTLVGLALMLGCLTRFAAACGMLMLALYYLAYPPLFGTAPAAAAEGHYLLVDKNLVELLALAVVAAAPTAGAFGLDRLLPQLWRRLRGQRAGTGVPRASMHALHDASDPGQGRDRRAVLAGLLGVPFLGAFILAALKKHGWGAQARAAVPGVQDKAPIPAQPKADAVTTATIKTFQFPTLADLKGQVPHAKLGNLTLSRLILGGNHIGGWSHARDLIYVDALVKQYHHKWKVFETFVLAEKCGINAFLTNPVLCGIIKEYWDRKLGKIQFVSDCGGTDIMTGVKTSIDSGAAACYVHGGMADAMAARKQYDQIAKALDLIRASGLPAGIGAHKLATVTGCVEAGLKPDFWMKTLHHHRYWSARDGRDECDNLWCDKPDETIAFMRARPEPWIAFKILAAGAIRPADAFRYALKNGADFLCVGMYDFQLVEDANIFLESLAENQQRDRPWRA